MSTLTAARDRALRRVLEERRERRVRETLEAMRANYSIKVEMPLSGTAEAGTIGNNG